MILTTYKGFIMFKYLADDMTRVSELETAKHFPNHYPNNVGNYKSTANYYCEYDGGNLTPKPLRAITSSSYNSITGGFTSNGTIVLGCPYCGRPVYEG